MSNVTERFLKYVSVDTQSADFQENVPSTQKQFDLAKILADELKEMGACNVRLSENCYVYATVPATPGFEHLPSVGFVAHMDTSNAVSGKDIKPVITENYNGGDIKMSEGYTLSPDEYPVLMDYVGQTVICSDGTTLLGADDKAGVAEIMSLAELLLGAEAPEHCCVQIAFTPDEEVGRGVDFFDIKNFGADVAYTVDGGAVGDFNYECFNAAGARVHVSGISCHTGSAKNVMKNSLLVAMELQSLLPEADKPAYTEGYEGFYHLDSMNGSVDATDMYFIIRDHDKGLFEKRKAAFADAVSFLNRKYGEGTVTADIYDQYPNMREIVEQHMELVDNALKAMDNLGIKASIDPIRGGTDGARLSFMGLPCPNLCTGGHNFHGRYEFITAESLEKCADLLAEIVKIYTVK